VSLKTDIAHFATVKINGFAASPNIAAVCAPAPVSDRTYGHQTSGCVASAVMAGARKPIPL